MRLQWLVLAVIVLAGVLDHQVIWRTFERRVTSDTARARRGVWTHWMLMMWGCTALVIGLWIAQDRPLSALGLALPEGWRLSAPAVLVVAIVGLQANVLLKISRHKGDKTTLRAQFGTTALIMPHEASELPAFLGLSVTAGFCEELLIRGFMIWMFQPFAGWWGAAVASLALFALGHLYQGKAGVVRTAAVGAALTVIVFVTRSLWPAIVLHAALDWMGGLTGWLVMRDALRGGEAQAASPV
jgi:uncharacterized protein